MVFIKPVGQLPGPVAGPVVYFIPEQLLAGCADDQMRFYVLNIFIIYTFLPLNSTILLFLFFSWNAILFLPFLCLEN